GTEGEENYDRGIRSGHEDYAPWGGNRFSNETYGYWREGGPHRGRGPKNLSRSDERIREDVCEGLMEDPHVDASEIEVTVANGEVTLSGATADRLQKRRAEEVAEAVSGVHHVQNNLRIETGPRTGGGGTVSGGTPEPQVADRTDMGEARRLRRRGGHERRIGGGRTAHRSAYALTAKGRLRKRSTQSRFSAKLLRRGDFREFEHVREAYP
ncbi:MAG TPA: BON domain-containing protein, partial [Beijerinckiaceae bacterium]|nr:BON domain-containing protein [Beijerinckiaceae bacterium]